VVLYDFSLGLLRRSQPAEVRPRCAYSDHIFFEGDHGSGSIFSSSLSLHHRLDGVCGSLDMLAIFEGDRSKHVGGCTRIAFVIAWTGLGCGIRNSAQVDVARLGFIWSSVTKFGLKGTTPVTLKATRTVDSSNASRYAGTHTVMNSVFDTLRMCFDSKATIAICQQTFIFPKHMTSSPWSAWVQCGGYPSKMMLFSRQNLRNFSL
jgi:hypothetical protein